MNEGIYPARVIKTDCSLTQKGELRIGVELQVQDEKMWGNLYFSEKALPIARKSLKAIGFDPDTRSIGELEANPELLAGNECDVTIKVDTYKGDGRMKVAFINPKKIRPTQDKLAELDAAIRAIKSDDEKSMDDLMTPKNGDPDYKGNPA